MYELRAQVLQHTFVEICIIHNTIGLWLPVELDAFVNHANFFVSHSVSVSLKSFIIIFIWIFCGEFFIHWFTHNHECRIESSTFNCVCVYSFMRSQAHWNGMPTHEQPSHQLVNVIYSIATTYCVRSLLGACMEMQQQTKQSSRIRTSYALENINPIIAYMQVLVGGRFSWKHTYGACEKSISISFCFFLPSRLLLHSIRPLHRWRKD